MIQFIRKISSSMTGKMTMLTLITLLLGFFYFIIIPRWNYSDNSDLVDRTSSLVAYHLWMYAQEQNGNEVLEKFRFDSSVFEEVKKHNPNFKYFVHIKKGEINTIHGEKPRWFNDVSASSLDLSLNRPVESQSCELSLIRINIREEQGIGRVTLNKCYEDTTYIEYSGIKKSIPRIDSSFWDLRIGSLLQQYRRYFILGFSVFIIALLLIYFSTRSINRVARIARSFNPNELNLSLPEKGIPLEILPLIQSINFMMIKLGLVQTEKNFFLSTAAHEMRTPLAILRTRLEELPDSEIKNLIIADVRRLIDLVNQLLKLMNIRNRNKPSTSFNLITTIKDVISERAPYTIKNKVSIEFSSPFNEIIMQGDSDLLKVAFYNLIDNSVSFSNKSQTVFVEIDCNKIVKIHDQGPGFRDEKINGLFEPFSKSPSNRKGHGLGLAIVKAIINLHEGKVRAYNKRNFGACVEVDFGLNKQD